MINWVKSLLGIKRDIQLSELRYLGTPPPPCPPTRPPAAEDPMLVYYRLGPTSDNRIAFYIGNSNIVMNKEGAKNLIEQITLFINQLPDSTDDNAH